MTLRSRGDDLEIIPIEDGPAVSTVESSPGSSAGGEAKRGLRWAADRRPAQWRLVAWGVGVAAVVLVAAFVVAAQPARRGHSAADRTAEEINGRLAVTRTQVITVLGSKMIARPVTSQNGGVGLVGGIDLAPAATVAVTGGWVLAQGTGFNDDGSAFGPAGTWAFPTDGSRGQVYLGVSTGFQPTLDPRLAVLTTGSTAWDVNVSDGSTVAGPYHLDGQLVGVVGRGLVLQRGSQVVVWNRDSPGDTVVIGRGTALGGWFEYVLWRRGDGHVAITDANTSRTWVTAVTVRRDRPVSAVALSPGRLRVAAVAGGIVHIGDGIAGHHALTATIAGVRDIAWADDATLLATVGSRGLVTIDGATGVVVHEPDFIFDSNGLALLPPAATPPPTSMRPPSP